MISAEPMIPPPPPMTPGEALLRHPIKHPTMAYMPYCNGLLRVPHPMDDWPSYPREPWTPPPTPEDGGGSGPLTIAYQPAGQLSAETARTWSMGAALTGAVAFGALAYLAFSSEAREGPARRRKIDEGRAALARHNPRRKR